MVQVDEKERIRTAHFLQDRSIREIARQMHHSRKTVRKALSDPLPPVYARKEPASSPVMDPVREIIDKWIEEDEHRPRKQRHTAHRIYERLRDEHGFRGCESTVRRYVQSKRKRPVELWWPSHKFRREAGGAFAGSRLPMPELARDQTSIGAQSLHHWCVISLELDRVCSAWIW